MGGGALEDAEHFVGPEERVGGEVQTPTAEVSHTLGCVELRLRGAHGADAGLQPGHIHEYAARMHRMPILEAYGHMALHIHAAAILCLENRLDRAHVLPSHQPLKERRAMLVALRMDDVEQTQRPGFHLAVAQRLAPGAVHVDELARRGNALNEIVRVLKQIPVALLAFAEGPLGDLRAGDVPGYGQDQFPFPDLDRMGLDLDDDFAAIFPAQGEFVRPCRLPQDV